MKTLTLILILLFASPCFADIRGVPYGVLDNRYLSKVSDDASSYELRVTNLSADSISTDAISTDSLYLRGYSFPTDAPADNDVIKWDTVLGRLNYEADATGAGGAGIPGIGNQFQITYWGNTDASISGDAGLTYNPTTDVLTTPVISILSNDAALIFPFVSADVANLYANANLTGEVTSVGNAATIADNVTVQSWTMITPALGTPTELVGTNITGTGASFTAGNVKAFRKSFVITSPTATADGALWRVPAACTITAVHGVQVGGTNVIGHLDECDANGLNGAGVDGATDMTILTTNVNDDGTLSNPSIDSGDYIGWHTTSVSGTITRVTISFEGTWD